MLLNLPPCLNGGEIMYWLGIIICGVAVGNYYSEFYGWLIVGVGFVVGGLINAYGRAR